MSFGDTNISFSKIANIIDGRAVEAGTAISLSSFRGKIGIPSSGPISIQDYFKGKTFTSFPPLTDGYKILSNIYHTLDYGGGEEFFLFIYDELIKFLGTTSFPNASYFYILRHEKDKGFEYVKAWTNITNDTYHNNYEDVKSIIDGIIPGWKGNGSNEMTRNKIGHVRYEPGSDGGGDFPDRNEVIKIFPKEYPYIGTSTSLYNYIGKRKIQNDNDSATYSWIAVELETTNFQTSSNYEKSVGGAAVLETISYSFNTKSWASEITITFNYRDANNEEKTFSKGRNGTSSLSNYTTWNGTLSVYPKSTVTINGNDSYGDGWHGAYLTITYNENQIASRTVTSSNMVPILFEVGGEVVDGLGFREDFTPTIVSNLVSFETNDQGGNIVAITKTTFKDPVLYTDIIFGGYDYNTNREHIGAEFTIHENEDHTYDKHILLTLLKVNSKDTHIDEIVLTNSSTFDKGYYTTNTITLYLQRTGYLRIYIFDEGPIYPSNKKIGYSNDGREKVKPGDSFRLTVHKNSSNNCDIVVWSRSHENSIWVKNHTKETTYPYINTYWTPVLSLHKHDSDNPPVMKIKNFQLIDQADDVKGEWAYFEFDEEVFLSKLIIRMGNINVWQRQVKIISLVASDEPDAQTSNVAVLTHFEGYPSDANGNYDESNKEYATFDFEKYISTVKYKKNFKYWGLIIENLKGGSNDQHLNIRYIQFFKKNVEENLFTSTLPTVVNNTKITVKDWSTQYSSGYTPSNVLNTNTDIWENGNSKDGRGGSRRPYNSNGYYSDPLEHKLNIISNL